MSRTEKMHVVLNLDHNQASRHRRAINEIMGTMYPVHEGDTLNINYTFRIEYIGNIVDKFNALLELLNDPGVVKSATHVELLHNHCLFEELITKLQLIEKRLQ